MSTVWQDRAACAGTDPEAQDRADNGDTADAKAYCNRCPVQTTCLEVAMDAEGSDPAPARYGVAGGLDRYERYDLYRERAGLKPVHRRTEQSGTSVEEAATRQRVMELHAEGLSDSEIAEQIGSTKESVRYIRNRLGLPANDPHSGAREVIAELHAQGLTDLEIAGRTGQSRHAVSRRRLRMELPANPPRQAVTA